MRYNGRRSKSKGNQSRDSEMREIFFAPHPPCLHTTTCWSAFVAPRESPRAARELVEFVSARNMPVQRRGIELRQNINATQGGIDAIGDRDVHEPVFSSERHRPAWRGLSSAERAACLVRRHDDGKNVAGVE